MFIGHIPAGYLLSTCLRRRISAPAEDAKRFVVSGVLGAVAPDLDLLYFYLIDHGRHHHHTYFPHLPIFWIGLTLLFAGLRNGMAPRSSWSGLGLIFAINGLGHVVLDSIVGDIWWLAPWVDRPYSLFSIRRHLDPWWLNFVCHPSFALEVVLVLAAFIVWRKRGSCGRGSP